jgi:hypothetical protein
LKQAQVDDARIVAYTQIALESRSSKKRRQQKEPRDPARLSYAEVEEMIYARQSGLVLLWKWGQQASKSDLVQAARKLETEHDPTILPRLLALFRKASFPLDYHLLFALSQHAEERVAASAIGVLENIGDPAVRAFALDMISQSFRPGRMTALLAKNFRDGDWQLIEEVTVRDMDRDEYHFLGFSVRHVFAANPNIESMTALLNLYEKGPCANCRVSVLKCLHQLATIPLWITEECRSDSNFDLREYAQKSFVGLDSDW